MRGGKRELKSSIPIDQGFFFWFLGFLGFHDSWRGFMGFWVKKPLVKKPWGPSWSGGPLPRRLLKREDRTLTSRRIGSPCFFASTAPSDLLHFPATPPPPRAAAEDIAPRGEPTASTHTSSPAYFETLREAWSLGSFLVSVPFPRGTAAPQPPTFHPAAPVAASGPSVVEARAPPQRPLLKCALPLR